ncbi:MAG: formate dehydrogenase accessory sulfurtransferase FdhD [Deltaproteobacteria bacterium]|nr:formate dehydrogenase accessory sulfurtransferase FdhD [Deltaproteobacteria bacterium]
MADQHPLEPLIQVEIVKVTPEGRRVESDVVATEVPVTIMDGAVEIATLMCTPENLDDLARGFLYTSGLLARPEDFLDCEIDPGQWVARVRLARSVDPSQLASRAFTTGCGKGVLFGSPLELAGHEPLPSGFTVAAPRIQDLANWFRRYSDLHHATGGVHTVALSLDGAEPGLIRDDVGRHNGMDKVVGRALRDALDLTATILITSGRISSEIVHKARRAGIPVLVSLGAPTHQAVLQARELNVTLVGFARQARFSIFSAPERIR